MKISFNPLINNVKLNNNMNVSKYGLKLKNQLSHDTVSFGSKQDEFPNLYYKSRYMSIYEYKKELEKQLGKKLEDSSDIEILRACGIQAQEDDETGMLTLNRFSSPSTTYSFADIGVDEDKLFEKTIEIKGDADFRNSTTTNLGKLRKIGGDADFRFSKVEDVGDLREIEGSAYFEGSKIKSLKNIVRIGKDAWMIECDLEDTGKLRDIGRGARFWGSKITDLANIRHIGGDVSFADSYVRSIGDLKSIEGDVFYSSRTAKIAKKLENDKIVKGRLYLV